LAQGFHGIYFPIQYQVFSFCSWLVQSTGLNYFIAFKAVTLVFDIGSFVLLLLIFKKLKVNKLFALIYWLHPWFIVIFSEGYIDFQFVFFILLTIYILLFSQNWRHYLWAGLPLGVAFLMKPQAQLLIFAAAAFAFFNYLRNRKFDKFALLIFPVALFLGYELYFFISLLPNGMLKALFFLPRKYLAIQFVMPVLTANMLNFWYPIAYFLKAPGDQIWSVTSNYNVLPHIKVQTIASLVVVGIVSCYTFFMAKKKEEVTPDGANNYLCIFTFVALVVPFLMTSAHENHLFLATVLLVILFAKIRSLIFRWAIMITFFIQFVNVYLFYFNDRFSNFIMNYYSFGLRALLSVVSVALFVLIIRAILIFNFKSSDSQGSLEPSISENT
jgi:hypothetical protein